MDNVKCFLPCRKGSERVLQKNVKPFAGIENGLIEIKLRQLIDARRVDQILLSTDDDSIIEYARGLDTSKIVTHRRKDDLCSSATSTDDLVAHAREVVGEGHILWTHVTSPFVSANLYDEIISKYFSGLENGYDSLMTAYEIHGFLWDDDGPINYDRRVEKWPRTQTLRPIRELNSAAFIASSEIYDVEQDRIGKRPVVYGMDKIIGMDIDLNEDFTIAESILLNGIASI